MGPNPYMHVSHMLFPKFHVTSSNWVCTLTNRYQEHRIPSSGQQFERGCEDLGAYLRVSERWTCGHSHRLYRVGVMKGAPPAPSKSLATSTFLVPVALYDSYIIAHVLVNTYGVLVVVIRV